MFLLRRAALRAVAAPFNAASCKALPAQPRSLSTLKSSALRTQQRQWSIAFQRRFASDDSAKTDAAQAAAAEVPENFAQTATEPPMEDGLTPAQQEAQAEPTDAEATVGPDALEQAAKMAQETDPTRQARTRPSATPNKTLYIGNLYYEVTGEQLKKVFSRFGEVESVKIIYDNRGLSRGFGYVDFTNISDAQSAIDSLDMQVFEGRNLVVQFHAPKNHALRGSPPGTVLPSPPSRTLFIGNMSFEMSDKDLNDLFRDISNVHEVRVAIDRRTGQPRGFAHADFTDVASATRAKEVLSEKVIYGRELRVDYSKSVPRQHTRQLAAE